MYTTLEDFIQFLGDILARKYNMDINIDLIEECELFPDDAEIKVCDSDVIINTKGIMKVTSSFATEDGENILSFDLPFLITEDNESYIEDIYKIKIETKTILSVLSSHDELGIIKNQVIEAVETLLTDKSKNILTYDDYCTLIDMIMNQKKKIRFN